MLLVQNVFVRKKYGKVVHMFYGKVVYLCHIDKYMLDEMEQFNNESIHMAYLRKIYMNIFTNRT